MDITLISQIENLPWVPKENLHLFARTRGLLIIGNVFDMPQSFQNAVYAMLIKKKYGIFTPHNGRIGVHWSVPITRYSCFSFESKHEI
jgi:hypothetical protein